MNRIIFVTILSITVGLGESIRCYAPDGIKNCSRETQIDSCFKLEESITSNGIKNELTLRGCGKPILDKEGRSEKLNSTEEEIHIYRCSTDLCNGVSQINPITAVFLTLPFTIYLFVLNAVN